MQRILRAGVLATGLALPGAVWADVPREMVSRTLDEALAILRDPSLPEAQKRARIEKLAYERFDFERMSRLVLGRSYKKLSEPQRAAFAQEFRRHLSATYGRRVGEYSNERMEVREDRAERNGDVTVKTVVVGGPHDGATVDYRMREREGRWYAIDVIIEGVSLIANFRSQVQDLVSTKGPDELIRILREKNDSAAAAPAR